jgi:hypothetical protein
MRIDVLEFIHSFEPPVFAWARIGLFGWEHSVMVDVPVLLDRYGPLVTMPSSVAFSDKLRRDVEDVVLPAFQKWLHESHLQGPFFLDHERVQ